LWLALAASVALNIFFVGFFVARFARSPHDGRASTFETWNERGALREKWREHMSKLGPHREAVETARRAVRAALAAEPFDAAALAAALAALRTETNDTQAALDEALVRFAGGLSPEERRRLAESRWFGALEGRGMHPR
jgi:uncharacterized membrane protein